MQHFLEKKEKAANMPHDATQESLFDNFLACERPVDVEGIAEFLGKQPGTIRNWVSTGEVPIPHFRLGNKSMFFRSRVVEWLRSLERIQTCR